MSRLRIALLGCGGIAARHVAAMRALGDRMELVACCGRDIERTRAFAAEHGGDPFVDLEAMLDESKIDLLVATLPPYCRAGEIEAAAERGIHLLVEKPIALDMAAADRMVARVEAAGVVAAIGFMYRFGDAVRRWRELDTGAVGLYAGSYHCNALHAHWWRKRALSGGQILEQAIHQIDLIRHLVGERSDRGGVAGRDPSAAEQSDPKPRHQPGPKSSIACIRPGSPRSSRSNREGASAKGATWLISGMRSRMPSCWSSIAVRQSRGFDHR